MAEVWSRLNYLEQEELNRSFLLISALNHHLKRVSTSSFHFGGSVGAQHLPSRFHTFDLLVVGGSSKPLHHRATQLSVIIYLSQFIKYICLLDCWHGKPDSVSLESRAPCSRVAAVEEPLTSGTPVCSCEWVKMNDGGSSAALNQPIIWFEAAADVTLNSFIRKIKCWVIGWFTHQQIYFQQKIQISDSPNTTKTSNNIWPIKSFSAEDTFSCH